MYSKVFKIDKEHDFVEFLPSICYEDKENGKVGISCHNTKNIFVSSYTFNHGIKLYSIDYVYCPYCGKKILSNTGGE